MIQNENESYKGKIINSLLSLVLTKHLVSNKCLTLYLTSYLTKYLVRYLIANIVGLQQSILRHFQSIQTPYRGNIWTYIDHQTPLLYYWKCPLHVYGLNCKFLEYTLNQLWKSLVRYIYNVTNEQSVYYRKQTCFMF